MKTRKSPSMQRNPKTNSEYDQFMKDSLKTLHSIGVSKNAFIKNASPQYNANVIDHLKGIKPKGMNMQNIDTLHSLVFSLISQQTRMIESIKDTHTQALTSTIAAKTTNDLLKDILTELKNKEGSATRTPTRHSAHSPLPSTPIKVYNMGAALLSSQYLPIIGCIIFLTYFHSAELFFAAQTIIQSQYTLPLVHVSVTASVVKRIQKNHPIWSVSGFTFHCLIFYTAYKIGTEWIPGMPADITLGFKDYYTDVSNAIETAMQSGIIQSMKRRCFAGAGAGAGAAHPNGSSLLKLKQKCNNVQNVSECFRTHHSLLNSRTPKECYLLKNGVVENVDSRHVSDIVFIMICMIKVQLQNWVLSGVYNIWTLSKQFPKQAVEVISNIADSASDILYESVSGTLTEMKRFFGSARNSIGGYSTHSTRKLL